MARRHAVNARRAHRYTVSNAAVILAGLLYAIQALASSPIPDDTLAMPPGIRIKFTYFGDPRVNSQPPRRVFADGSNLPLYFYDKDPPGQSTCTDVGGALWKRALAPSGAKPMGEWSLIRCKDRSVQWAFRKRALYTYAKDQGLVPSPVQAFSGQRNISPYDRANGQGLEEGAWQALVAAPDPEFQTPPGIDVSEVGSAPGQALVDDAGHTLYVFQGRGAVGSDWIPVTAPMVAVRKFGNFSVQDRPDGLSQWAVDRKPLYRYRRDNFAGDANGSASDPRFRVALLMRYFMPAGIAIRQDELRGGILMTEAGHRTLYAQDFLYIDSWGGQHARGKRGAPAAGEELGISGCVDKCLQSWHPLRAPDNATARGDWTVYVRPDGSKQWGYQGFALYTYAEDGPDQLNGVDVYNISVPLSRTDRPVARNFGTYWRAASVSNWVPGGYREKAEEEAH